MANHGHKNAHNAQTSPADSFCASLWHNFTVQNNLPDRKALSTKARGCLPFQIIVKAQSFTSPMRSQMAARRYENVTSKLQFKEERMQYQISPELVSDRKSTRLNSSH